MLTNGEQLNAIQSSRVFKGLGRLSFKALGDALPAGLLIIERNKGEVSYVNKRAVELFGFSPRGLTLRDFALNRVKVRRVDGGKLRYEELPLVRALVHGETQRNQELTFQRPNHARLSVSLHASPLVDGRGEISAALAIFEDVTERKKAEEALRQKKQKMGDILASIDDYVYSLDRNWNISYVNNKSADDWNFQPESMVGKNFWRTFPLYIGTEVESNYREAMNRKEIKRFEWKTVYARGYREFTVFPSSEGITIYGRDITDRKLLQKKLEDYSKNLERLVKERTEQLKDAERLATIGQVAGMVGHDIRNPLQTIVNELYCAKGELDTAVDCEGGRKMMESLSLIQEQVDYISKIVSDLQDYSKTLQPNLCEIDLREAIGDTLKIIKVPSNIEATTIFQDHLPMVELDQTYLKRILSNLLMNAVQAMPQGGKLTVEAFQDVANTVITVEDTGEGVPLEARSKLFTPLFTTKAKGQGLGLAVVKRMTEAMHGTVNFESQLGKGTKFTITFPKKRR